jgi:2,5-diketo-D-gluconate reductase B
MADELNISVSQLCLTYLLKKGFIVIPKASSIEHLKDNYSSLDINLSDEIIKKVDSLSKNYRYVNPPFAPKWN